MKRPTILLAEREDALRQRVQTFLQRNGFSVVASPDRSKFLQALRQIRDLALLIMNASFETVGDMQLVQQVCQAARPLPLIVIAPHSSEDLAIAALRAGVADYFKVPFSDEELLVSVRRCCSPGHTQSSVIKKARSPCSTPSFAAPLIVGEGASMQAVKSYLVKVAATDSTALITGETGTGKELVAAFLHEHSRRWQKPFVHLNCAALPDSLLESELFGYERGAFTGADSLKEGALRLAAGGTVFFDEIGDMSPYAQAKILRAIEGKEVRPLGGKGSIPLDIRVVAATNRNLEQLMAEEKFRSDLYFRLNVANIHLPPLRERKEDLQSLCDHYIRQMNQECEREVEGFTEDAFAALLRYNWPGNIRELRNLIEAIFINLPSRKISFLDLPEQFRRRLSDTAELPHDERDQVLGALFSTNWNKSLAAQKLRWSRMTLYRKMVKYHIVGNGRAGHAQR